MIYERSTCLGGCDKYLIGFTGPPNCAWRKGAPICLSHSLLSTIYQTLARGSERMGGDISRCCGVFSAVHSLSLRFSNVKG